MRKRGKPLAYEAARLGFDRAAAGEGEPRFIPITPILAAEARVEADDARERF